MKILIKREAKLTLLVSLLVWAAEGKIGRLGPEDDQSFGSKYDNECKSYMANPFGQETITQFLDQST